MSSYNISSRVPPAEVGSLASVSDAHTSESRVSSPAPQTTPRPNETFSGMPQRSPSSLSSSSRTPRVSTSAARPPLSPAIQQSDRLRAESEVRQAAVEVGSALEHPEIPEDVHTPASLMTQIATHVQNAHTALTARLQTMTGGAVTAGLTFGLFRGLGAVAEHTSDQHYSKQLLTALKGIAIGGAAGGLGNVAAVGAITPAITAAVTKIMQKSASLAPVNAEKLVPDHWPPEHRAKCIAQIKEAQSKFGVDSITNILAGMVSFGASNALRAAETVNQGLPPLKSWGEAIGGSAGAGAVTGLITDTMKGLESVKLKNPDGTPYKTVSVFEHQSAPPKEMLKSMETGWKSLVGDGSVGAQAMSLLKQYSARTAAVTLSTLPLAAAQSAIPLVSKSLQQNQGQTHEDANAYATGMMNAVAFMAVVGIYFYGLGAISRHVGVSKAEPAPQARVEPDLEAGIAEDASATSGQPAAN